VGLKNDINGVKFALVLQTKLTKGRFFLKNSKKNSSDAKRERRLLACQFLFGFSYISLLFFSIFCGFKNEIKKI
jgi:hypothetical protein